MTPQFDDLHSDRSRRPWARPLAHFAHRRGRAQPLAVMPVRLAAAAPMPSHADALDDGEDLLRRLREAGL